MKLLFLFQIYPIACGISNGKQNKFTIQSFQNMPNSHEYCMRFYCAELLNHVSHQFDCKSNFEIGFQFLE